MNNVITLPTLSDPRALEVPVLFLVFNRLDTTQQVFNAIKQAKPKKLYIAADGARKAKQGEEKKTKSVRGYIISNIDWECEVKTLFRDENLGCKLAVSQAVSWFFENEEMGIILEDDCLPSYSFFFFCEELLKKYANDLRIWQITGNNFQNNVIRGDGDYYFSKFNHIWGWATWANRWKCYDVELNHINNDSFLKNIVSFSQEFNYWSKIFKKMKNKEIDTWDYQWTFTTWVNSGLTATPQRNLISNIGFGKGATHTTTAESELANMERHEILSIKYPSYVLVSKDADIYVSKTLFVMPLYKKIIRKIVYIFNKVSI